MTSTAGRTALTPMQKQILRTMADGEPAAFNGDHSRRLGFGVDAAKYGGSVIRAYGLPEWFLQNRGLIEPIQRNVPGIWYRITDAGRALLSSTRKGG